MPAGGLSCFGLETCFQKGIWVSWTSHHGKSVLQVHWHAEINPFLLELPPSQRCLHFECIQSFNGRVCAAGKQHLWCSSVFFWCPADANKCMAMVVLLLTYYPQESSGAEGFIFLQKCSCFLHMLFKILFRVLSTARVLFQPSNKIT